MPCSYFIARTQALTTDLVTDLVIDKTLLPDTVDALRPFSLRVYHDLAGLWVNWR